METKKHSSSLPAGTRRERTKTTRRSRWLGLLVTFVLLFAANQNIRAAMAFGSYSSIVHQPTWAQPWIVLDLYFYDTNGNDSFFVHKATEGSAKGPAMYIDGVYIDSFNTELAWPGSSSDTGGTGNDGALDDERADNDWWKDTHEVTRNGKKYTVRFWDPAKDGGRFHVQVYIWIENLELDVKHNVVIKGWWKTNDSGTVSAAKVWETNKVTTPFSAPENGKMVNYNTFSMSGDITASYGPTTVGTTATADGSNYIAPGALTSKHDFSKGVASYTNERFSIERTNFYEPMTKQMEYVVTNTCTVNSYSRTVYLYKWFTDTIPGFVRATALDTVPDLWKKSIKISWKPDESGDRSKEGTWRVYRKAVNESEWNLLASNISYSSNPSYIDTDNALQYDLEYEYKVVFIPAESPTGVEHEELSQTIVGKLQRKYSFSQFTDTRKEQSVQLSWKHDTPTNNEQLKFKVWRCLDQESFYDQNGTPIEANIIDAMGSNPFAENVAASSSGNVTSFEDDDYEGSCTFYWYRISVDALETTYYSNLLGPTSISGNTEIQSIKANRGTYTNVVKVQWEVNQVGSDPSRFVVYRRLLGSEEDDDYQQLHVVSGTESNYFFEDNTAQPGQYYQYLVVSQSKCDGDYVVTSRADADGFCQSRGVISGRITYGTGTAVADARVMLSKSSQDSNDANQFYSMEIKPQGGIEWPLSATTGEKIFQQKPFTFQLYVRPSAVTEDGSTIIDAGGSFALQLKPVANDQSELYLKVGSATAQATGLTIENGKFYNVVLSCNGSTGWTVSTVDQKGNLTSQTLSAAGVTWTDNNVVFGSDKEFTTTHAFTGYLDDIRLWTKQLTDDEILSNYDRLLTGTEAGLKLYWPMDEGVARLPYTYDYSKTSGVANENHGVKQPNTQISNTIPKENQLSLYGKTDDQGNYVVRGVPYSGDGTNYMVTPVMNSHEFSPQYQSRYVSSDALNHSGVDFTDISSFEVKGVIRYAGTNIPVDSVQIYVDGRQASRNNEIVVTDADGKFTVDVPIGKHYISVSKDGHTFEKGGRIPYDPTGLNETTYEFIKNESGFVFWDNTLVPVAGRVVGGAIESEKLLGFADIEEYKSKNTIGQARITLEIPDTRYMLNAYEDMEGLVSNGFRPVAQNTSLTYPTGVTATGEGYRTGGTQDDQAKRVVITTDAETGDFAVLLPPLDYKVVSVQMVNDQANEAYKFNSEQLPRIDASHPATVLKDSIPMEDGGFRYFDYVASMKLTLHTDPVLSVRQKEKDSKNLLPEGVFGEAIGKYEIPTTKEVRTVDLYTVGTNGNVNYTFGYPIFNEMGSYTFNIEGYELYTNFEKAADDDDRVTKVPLKETMVTISNPMSAVQKVQTAAPQNGDNAGKVVDLKENQLQLDSLGKATYTWTAGLPYTLGNFTRTMNMTYNNGAGDKSWKEQGLEAIIFGDLPTGSNFTTKGPSIVEMVLHDPYGDSSFATWETGTVTIRSEETLRSEDDDETFSTNMHLGPKVELEEGLFVSIQTEIEAIADFSGGYQLTNTYDTLNVHTTTIEVTNAISTSSDPDMVGADADIYIGKSVNFIYGKTKQVGLKSDVNGNPYISVDNSCTVNEKLATNFSYTQYQIENILIPGLELLRNGYLITVPDMETATNQTDSTIYVTNLSDTDEDFGKPGTYKMLSNIEELDMVSYYNDEIQSWKNTIRQNEAYKDSLFNAPQAKMKNVSFGGGVEVSETVTSSKNHLQNWTHSHTYYVNYSHDLGGTFNGVGIDFSYESHCSSANHNNGNGSEGHTEEDESSTTFSYTLADSGADDSFSMDVYDALNNHSPVFRTRGGQSSCPFEGKEVTRYYNPGTELSAATMQIEKPSIKCDHPQLTGVPTGGKAQFELLLGNESDTETDCYFNLIPVDGANPKGALLSLPTGPIGNGRTILVPYGKDKEVKVILTLEQGNLDVTDYEDIEIALTSTCQNDPTSIHGAISSSVKLDAHFVPASTPVTMAIDKTVINTNNKDEDLHLTVTGFDRNFQGLKRVDIQYIKPGETSWSLLENYSYIPDNSVRENNSQQILPQNGVIEVALNMNSSNWLDGTYQFRAQSAAIYAGSPVTSESEVLTLVKDVNRPQLFGLASPSDGVLNADDQISVTFNEDIQQALLTDNNFVVSGVLNGAQVKHDVALSAQNTDYAAKTEASINLARKDFSADMWVRVTEAGDIFSHGNGDERFKLSVNDNDKLVVTIGNESYTSTNAIEKNTWTFLAFTYKFESGNSVLNARAVTDNSTRDMFTNQAVADYAGTGGVTLGKNFSGAIHELTLWDKAREMNEAQAEMNTTKKPSTPNLIGYWKMDEGNGLTATDYARNRHLTLSNNTWYLNNDNKAVSLNGSNSLKLDITDCSALSTEDYAMEMWFKGDKAQNTAASTLFSAAEQSVSMGFNSTGTLTMTVNGVDTEISKNDYLDNAWHHLALNVLHSGNATVYVDGKAVKTMSASAVPALEGTWLYVGSKGGNASYFKGTVDEIRFWKASMTGDLLSSQRTQRLTGEEGGLVAYYSFEKLTRDTSTGIISSVSTAADQDKVYNSTTKEYVSTGKEAAMTSGTISYTDEAPALKVKPEATNVDFTFVSNERSIIINLDADLDRVEGTTLNFNVRGVKDMNGNESTEIVWTAYVKRNQLLWQGDNELSIEQQSGESTTFEAVIVNESGQSENWTLSGLPIWLTASATSGTLTAQSKKTITFTVDGSTAIGKYEQTIYLTGNNNIAEPLTINLKVKGDEPGWTVNTSGYQFTMSIVGQLQFQGKLSTDEDDIVAAFNEAGECVGVARPQYESAFDTYFTMMTVYGNNDGDLLTFKAYDASTGKVYPVVETAVDVFFEKDTRLGKLASPFIWNVTDKIEQVIDLKEGWNWMSLYVTPDNMSPSVVLADARDILTIINGPTSTAEYDPSIGWSGTLTAMNNASMYKLNATTDGTATIVGSPANIAGTQITVKSGLTWIGYPPSFTLSPADAFAGLDPEEDDMVKNQSSFAVYSEANAKWIGTLKVMEPGKGYIYSSETTASKTFTYPSVAPAGGAAKVMAYAEPYDYHFTPVAPETYPGNMAVIGQVVENGLPVEGIEVAAFVDDECRATIVSDADGYLFLLVPGDGKARMMTLRAYILGDETALDLPLTYQADKKLGTLGSPVLIDITDLTTGIGRLSDDAADGEYYDLSGRKLGTRPYQPGVYIRNGEKVVIKRK